MAFPWDVIRSANLANGFIVEDMKLGLDLALAGHSPVFCPSATVTSTFPTSGTRRLDTAPALGTGSYRNDIDCRPYNYLFGLPAKRSQSSVPRARSFCSTAYPVRLNLGDEFVGDGDCEPCRRIFLWIGNKRS